MASPSPLDLGEVLDLIFSFVPDARTLIDLSCVNTFWYRHASTQLMRRPYFHPYTKAHVFSSLAQCRYTAMQDPERLKARLGLIKYFSYGEDDLGSWDLDPSIWHNLRPRYLRVIAAFPIGHTILDHADKTDLSFVDFDHSFTHPILDVWGHLANLRHVRGFKANLCPHHDEKEALATLQQMPNLRIIELHSEKRTMGTAETQALLRHLLARPGLKMLHLTGFSDSDLLEARPSPEVPVSPLKSLKLPPEVFGSEQSLHKRVSASLQSAEPRSADEPDRKDWLTTLCDCHALTELNLSGVPLNRNTYPTALAKIARATPLMRVFRLRQGNMGAYGEPQDLPNVLREWPLLRDFRTNFFGKDIHDYPESEGAKALHAISELCPELEHLDVPLEIDLKLEWSNKGIFHHLRTLSVQGVEGGRHYSEAYPDTDAEGTLERSWAVVSHRMPRLKSLRARWARNEKEPVRSLQRRVAERVKESPPPVLPKYVSVRNRIFMEVCEGR